MPDQDSYLKRATDKVTAISNAARSKMTDLVASMSKVGSGSDGVVGAAKGRLAGRQKQLDDAVDDATEVRANGGLIGTATVTPANRYSKR